MSVHNRPFWADLHNHNSVGYGKGSLKRSYAIAEGSLLDCYAFTPHGLWHDLPENDPKMVDFHKQGFEKVKQEWHKVVQMANKENVDNSFVTFIALEWHSSSYGDYHVLFPGDTGEICAAQSVAELQDFVRRHNAIMIPHHVAYNKGWRGLNWDTLRNDLSPVVDIFSEHGNSLEYQTHLPMMLHSMGGAEKSQTVMEALKRGHIAGFTASSDNHYGHPASYGEGLTGIWAEKLTRDSIFDALQKRHTYAVTGDRICLKFYLADAMMGDIISSDSPRKFSYDVEALATIDYIQIIKNGDGVHNFVPQDPPAGKNESFLVRLEFGWDAMSSQEVTDWNIAVSIKRGELREVIPCFAGGDGSVEKTNHIVSTSSHEAAISAFTSRRNSRPTSAVVLKIDGDLTTTVSAEVDANYMRHRRGCRLSSSIGKLLNKEEWAAITDIFSAPKIRLGHAHGQSEVSITQTWTDDDPGPNDFYLVKVQQKNGQIAWSSPIWCTKEKGAR